MTEKPSEMADPVCGTVVPAGQHEAVHLDIAYAFCSEHCRDRFFAHPHLYIGRPGQKAPKQEGREVIERRRLRLDSALAPDHAEIVAEILRGMTGVKAVLIDGDQIQLSYDLLQVTAEQIEAQVGKLGAQLREGWPDGLRLAFIHYVEDCTIGSLEVSEPHLNGRAKRDLGPVEPFIP